ncbi:putative acetyltransferase [compost metagenome]
MIRAFDTDDALTISRLISNNLIHVNSRDYPPHIISSMVAEFTPEYVTTLSKVRQMFVALAGGKVVGTASLDEDTIYTVFVDKDHHGSGIGRLLIEHIESIARESGVPRLQLPSSLTAVRFYEKLGYYAVDSAYSEQMGHSIIMAKDIIPMDERKIITAQDMIPTHKSDFERVEFLKKQSLERIRPILPELLVWLQDINWPIASEIEDLLVKFQAELIPHIQKVLHTKDGGWKYFLLHGLINRLPDPVLLELKSDLHRMQDYPTKDEQYEELEDILEELLARIR